MAEAATAAYISQHTLVPVPKLFNYGLDVDIGPFMIMQDLGTRRDLADVLSAPREDLDEVPVLRVDIPEHKL